METIINKASFLIIAVIASSLNSSAQESRYFTVYFYGQANEETDQLRKYYPRDNQIITKDFKDGKLQLSGLICGTQQVDDVDDMLLYIRTQGQLDKYKSYFLGLTGTFTFYYETTGLPRNEIVFKHNKLLYSQAWSQEGEAQLIEGTGVFKSSSDEYSEDNYEEFQDSILVKQYAVRLTEMDTIYGKVDKLPEPKEGMHAFYQRLLKVLKYPVVARFVGKEGRVFIQFVVDDHGKLTDFEPRSKEGYGFEKKVIQKLEGFPSWNPAVFQGRFVKTRLVLPVTFKLPD